MVSQPHVLFIIMAVELMVLSIGTHLHLVCASCLARDWLELALCRSARETASVLPCPVYLVSYPYKQGINMFSNQLVSLAERLDGLGRKPP